MKAFLVQLKKLIAWAIIAAIGAFVVWGVSNRIRLGLRYDYTIAIIRKKYLDNHFQPSLHFDYMVDGKVYTHGATWDGKAKVGERYVLKYAVGAPHGFKLLFAHPVPDSLNNDSAASWQAFLRRSGLR